MTVNRLVLAVEALVVIVVAVGLWFAGSFAAAAVASRGIPPILAALALFPVLGALSMVAERCDVVVKAQLWHGAVVGNLELRVAQLALDDEAEGVAEDEDLYDEGVEGETR